MEDRWPGALISEIIACKDRMKKPQIPYDSSGILQNSFYQSTAFLWKQYRNGRITLLFDHGKYIFSFELYGERAVGRNNGSCGVLLMRIKKNLRPLRALRFGYICQVQKRCRLNRGHLSHEKEKSLNAICVQTQLGRSGVTELSKKTSKINGLQVVNKLCL